MKTCTKCRETKELDKFSKDKSKEDGHCTHCKECKSKWNKMLKEDNILQLEREVARTIRAENKLLLIQGKRICSCCKSIFTINLEIKNCTTCQLCNRLYSHNWRNKNKEKKYMLDKEYREKNRDKMNMLNKEWKKNNREKVNIKDKEYYEKNKNKIKEYMKEYRLKKKLEKQQQILLSK